MRRITAALQQFYSVLAPAATSSDIIRSLNQDVNREMRSTEIKNCLALEGSEVMVSTPEALERLIVVQIAKWNAVIRQAGIKPD